MLIGDAAHAIPAACGQSGSQAFEDAVVLTQILATEHSVPQALHDFEVKWLHRVKVIHNNESKAYAKQPISSQYHP